MIKVGTTIRKLRVERGFSQKELAKAANLTPSFVSLVEHDHREPSLSAIGRLADALRVPTEVVIWDAVDLPPNLTEEDRRLCEIAKMLVRRFYEFREDNTPHEEASGVAHDDAGRSGRRAKR